MARQVHRDSADIGMEWDFRHEVRVPQPISAERLIEIHQWCTDDLRPGEYLCYLTSGYRYPNDPVRKKHVSEMVFGFTDNGVAFEFKLRFV